MIKKATFLGVKTSMNLDINTDDIVYIRSCRMHLKIIRALIWPMTRLCLLSSSSDFRCCAIETDNALYPG